MKITCTFCNSAVGDEAPTIGSILHENGYEPEFFGDSDYEKCDECGRWTCMACAVFDFTGSGSDDRVMRFLCADCGQPTDVMMRRVGAPELPL